MSKIINSVRRLRFDHDEMTQEELARKVGVSRQTIIAMESGKYTPSLGLAFKLSEVFHRPLEEIFQVVEDTPAPKTSEPKTSKADQSLKK